MTIKLLKVGLWNAGSLGTKHDELTVAVLQRDVDIMAINETWLRVGEEGRAPVIPGYRLRHIPRPLSVRRGRGGGVGFYIKRGLTVRRHTHPTDPLYASVEQMWLTLSVCGAKLAIGTAYRPPWQDVDLFLDAISCSLNSVTQCDFIILMGDFNINLTNDSDPKTGKLQSFLDCMNLKQLVTTPTHTTVHGDTLIDVICTNVKARSVAVEAIPDLGAHALVTCEMNFKRPKILPKTICYRPLNQVSKEEIEQDLNLFNWQAITELRDVNEMVNTFNSFLVALFDVHAPKKTCTIRERSYPWITDTIKLMIRLRNEANDEYREYKTEGKKACYSELKSLVNVSLYREKSAYFTHNINHQARDPKLLWKNLKNTLLPPKNDIELPLHLNNPDAICDHFLNVPGNDEVSLSELTYFEFSRHNSSSFTLKPTTQSNIARILNSVKSNAEGCDNININMVILTLPATLECITSIINRSIEIATFPEVWKLAKIRPLPKIPNAADIKDLRPISILPVLSKVMEKVVSSQLVDYLEKNNILPDMQSGFRKARSTTTALLDVTDNILSAQDNGMCTLLVLLDFSRAFDCINIPLLLSKMTFYGFDVDTVKWFDSYLNRRTQFVEIRHTDGSIDVSSYRSVSRGVPQGSVLGPILFNLYCADITTNIKKCSYHIYADDTQIYISFKPHEYERALKDLHDDLERIVNWSKRNSLVLNPQKTKYMLFGTNTQLSAINAATFCIRVMGEPIDRVYEARNLGLIMDADLRFEKHVTEAIQNCFYRLKVIYKARPYLSEDLRILLVESLILSKLNYVDSVYGPRLLSKTERMIQRLQNACARFCFNIPFRSHVTPFFNKRNLLKMNARRKLHLASLMFSVIHSRTPLYLYDKLEWTHGYTGRVRRNCVPQLSIPRHRTAAFRGSFRYAATKCWNNIPPPIKKAKSSVTFKVKLKEFLLLHQKRYENVCITSSPI